LGGDEFVVILPETEAREATRLANRVCAELQAIRFESDAGVRFGAGCSFGVGGPGEADVLSAADGLLYAAKKRAKKQAVSKTVAV
jgi:diguanylate cyclase (GGDEF)-like protein